MRQPFNTVPQLDISLVHEAITQQTELSHIDITTFDVLDSTNNYLKRNLSSVKPWTLVFAEQQYLGKGRVGKEWVSPPKGNLYCSLVIEPQSQLLELACLGLVTAISLTNTLRELTQHPIQVKWPNDILFEHEKLGGILVESLSITPKSFALVVGIGLNFEMPKAFSTQIGQPFTALNNILIQPLSRDLIVSKLLSQLYSDLLVFLRNGFSSFHAQWQTLDALSGAEIELVNVNESMVGRVLGIDESGKLRLLVNDTVKLYQSGEISLKACSVRQ